VSDWAGGPRFRRPHQQNGQQAHAERRRSNARVGCRLLSQRRGGEPGAVRKVLPTKQTGTDPAGRIAAAGLRRALVSLRQKDTSVVATIKDLDSGASQVVHADYLVAADGTHSHIRRELGIATSGFGRLPIFVVFYFRAPWQQFIRELGDGDRVQINNADVTGIFIPAQGDLAVFVQTYFPSRGETVDRFTPERCRESILKAVGTPIDIEIVDIAPWQPYEQVADQFRCGRVFLVGDSAHTMPRSRAAEPTPPLTAHTTWRGNSPRC
jgi:2-polyprenyl-6-methoxyphenol hydroxylase-like FAD-dependent oxidoreductase